MANSPLILYEGSPNGQTVELNPFLLVSEPNYQVDLKITNEDPKLFNMTITDIGL